MSLDASVAALRALTDPTRMRLLATLEDQELTVAELLAPSARRIIGIERNERMVEAGRHRLKKPGHALAPIELLRADMHAVPVADGTFDFVLLQQSLQYADDPAQVIREAGRIL